MATPEFGNTFEARELLRKYRDMMVKEPHSSWLSPIICKMNEEIDRLTTSLNEAIKRGDATLADLFLLTDYRQGGGDA
jgi:hypothetical protein